MAVTLVPVAPLLTLIGLFIFGVGMFVIYRTRNVRPTWKTPICPIPTYMAAHRKCLLSRVRRGRSTRMVATQPSGARVQY